MFTTVSKFECKYVNAEQTAVATFDNKDLPFVS